MGGGGGGEKPFSKIVEAAPCKRGGNFSFLGGGSNLGLLRVNHICHPLRHCLVVRLIVVMLLLVPMTVKTFRLVSVITVERAKHILITSDMEREGFF